MYQLPARIIVLSIISGYLSGQTVIPPQNQVGLRTGWREYKNILNGMRALNVTVTTNRRSYLSGERICASIKVANSTSATILAFAPFGTYETDLNLFRKQDDEWVPYAEKEFPLTNDDSNGDMMAGRQIVPVRPGVPISQAVCLDGSTTQAVTRHPEIFKLAPGRYQLTFNYSNQASDEFQVMPSVGFSGYAALVIPELEVGRDPKSVIPPGCLGVDVAAIRTAENTVIVQGGTPTNTCPIRGSQQVDFFYGFTRIAESGDVVTRLAIKRLTDGRLRVIWGDNEADESHQVILPRPIMNP